MASTRARYVPGTNTVKGWIVDYKDSEGKKRTKGGFKTKAQAEDWITDYRAAMKDGSFISPKALSTRFEDVAEEWFDYIETRRRLKPRTIAGYRLIYDAHILPAFGKKKVGDISLTAIEKWLVTLEQDRSAQTTRNIHFALKACLNWAVRTGKLKVNPCTGVELPTPGTPHPRKPLTEAQVHEVASKLPEPYGLMTRFAAYTGLRRGELMALRVQSLNQLHKLVNVTEAVSGDDVSSPKTAAGHRTVPVPAALWDELTDYLGERINSPDSRVFPDPDDPAQPLIWRRFYRNSYQPAVRSLFPLSNGELVFHSLRHTYTSLLEELEVRPKIMSMVLGHSTGRVTFDTYTHVGPAQLAAVGERVNERYLSAAINQTLSPHLNDNRLQAVPSPAKHACPHCAGIGYLSDEAIGSIR